MLICIYTIAGINNMRLPHWCTGLGFGRLAVYVIVPAVHSLIRMSGTMKNGQEIDRRLRWTVGLRKMNGKWLITHEHVSLPVNLKSNNPVLEPAAVTDPAHSFAATNYELNVQANRDDLIRRSQSLA
jgi:hypothetical protein